jgi:hypothetical protein
MKGQFRYVFIAIALLCLLCSTVMAAPVTQNITYQGMLTNAGGTPLTGTYTVTFKLYEVSSGGVALTTDTHSVQASKGVFTTQITAASSFFDGQALWLGITVGADAEMTPRQELRPVPYALSLRPGSWITSNDVSSALTLQTTGGGRALNISTTGISSPGVFATTIGNDSFGVSAYTQGLSSPGVYVSTTGIHSSGVSATTTGMGSYGVAVSTSGSSSPGVSATTGGATSPGVVAYTIGAGSTGVSATTTGIGSEGFHAKTSNSNSPGVNATTTGMYSPGFSATTGGVYSHGVYARTTGSNSFGVLAETEGEGGYGVYVSTDGINSPGVHAYTLGTSSPGVSVITYGATSPGVSVNTEGSNSKGVSINTEGSNTEAIRAFAMGVGSYGAIIHSNQSYGLYAETSRTDNKYGIYTPDYLYAKGTQVPAADVAEYMPVTVDSTPGTVLVIGPDGKLMPSTIAYDTRVAGIVSTEPGMSLGTREDGNFGEALIAVAGRVPCNVDASSAPVHAGDLLTTSNTPGYAMKAEPIEINGRTFYPGGIVLGKAMGNLESGTGTIEVLVTLQ